MRVLGVCHDSTRENGGRHREKDPPREPAAIQFIEPDIRGQSSYSAEHSFRLDYLVPVPVPPNGEIADQVHILNMQSRKQMIQNSSLPFHRPGAQPVVTNPPIHVICSVSQTPPHRPHRHRPLRSQRHPLPTPPQPHRPPSPQTLLAPSAHGP